MDRGIRGQDEDTRQLEWVEVTLRGARSGLRAGLIIGAWLSIISAYSTTGLGGYFASVANTFQSGAEVVNDLGHALLGLVFHLVVAMALGALFLKLVWRAGRFSTVLAAAGAFGVLWTSLLAVVLLPWANPLLGSDLRASIPIWAFANLLFGLLLTLDAPSARQAAR